MTKTIKIMISSRCNDPIELYGKRSTFTEVRRKLKEEIEKTKLVGKQVFEVWINEDAPPEEGSTDSWEACLQQVDEADMVLIFYNGNAGWAKHGGDIGICHAEMERALSTAPAKVRLIELPLSDLGKKTEKSRNERFRHYAQTQSLFRGASAKNGDEAINSALQALHAAVVDMVGLGKREARKGKYHLGEALDWSRLDFLNRKAEMERIIRDYLHQRGGSAKTSFANALTLNIQGKTLLAIAHAVPAALSVAAAREMVGRPFLRDHQYAALLSDDVLGPLHFIACHKKVSESQAVGLLGQPDITVINAPFGIYAVDIVYHIQVVFLSDCRDQSSTRHALQRFFEWLEQSGEAALLLERAAKRMRIVETIAQEAQ
jgi:hypothetical protein